MSSRNKHTILDVVGGGNTLKARVLGAPQWLTHKLDRDPENKTKKKTAQSLSTLSAEMRVRQPSKIGKR